MLIPQACTGNSSIIISALIKVYVNSTIQACMWVALQATRRNGWQVKKCPRSVQSGHFWRITHSKQINFWSLQLSSTFLLFFNNEEIMAIFYSSIWCFFFLCSANSNSRLTSNTAAMTNVLPHHCYHFNPHNKLRYHHHSHSDRHRHHRSFMAAITKSSTNLVQAFLAS